MMAAEEGLPVLDVDPNSGNADFSGSVLLVVVGEPSSEDHKELVLEKLTKGLQSWDALVSGIDINGELEKLAGASPAGVEGQNGERIIQHYTENLQVDILINPEIQTLHTKLRNLLKKNVLYRHIVFAGHVFMGSGSWVLQDDRLTFSKFVSVFNEPDVSMAIKEHSDKILAISAFNEGDWNPSNFAKQTFGKILEVRLNPGTKLDSLNGVQQFRNYMSYYVNPVPVCDLLKASDVVGNIRFSRPTLYIFPGCEGDSALFGINGFNILINGGYGRKACFWDFTRHLDRIDALLLSHLGEDNLLGVSAVLERKARDNIHPEVGFVYFNGLDDKQKNSPNGDCHPEDGGSHKPPSLLVDLVQEGNKMIENMKCISQAPHPCVGKNLGTTLQPFNLYHKVGHGSLDMYVLNPLQDNKDLKDFFAQWNKQSGAFTSKNGIPLPHILSVAALLVWKPSSPSEKITRILLPGSVPQAKLFDGLDKLKTVDIFKHHECSEESLKAPAVSKTKKTPVAKVPPLQKASTPNRTPRKDAAESLSSRTAAPEKKRPIAKPGSSGKPTTTKPTKEPAPKKIDKKTTTKSGTDSDTKSTSSVETPPPVNEVVSPSESASTHDSAVAISEASTAEVDVPKQPDITPSPQVEETKEIKQEAPVLNFGDDAEQLQVVDSSPIDAQHSEESTSPTAAMPEVDQIIREASPIESFEPESEQHEQKVNELQIEEPEPTPAAPVDQFPPDPKKVSSVVDDSLLLEQASEQSPDETLIEQQQPVDESLKEEVKVTESPESLPDPIKLDSERFEHLTEPELPKTFGIVDDEKDVDTTENLMEQNAAPLLKQTPPTSPEEISEEISGEVPSQSSEVKKEEDLLVAFEMKEEQFHSKQEQLSGSEDPEPISDQVSFSSKDDNFEKEEQVEALSPEQVVLEDRYERDSPLEENKPLVSSNFDEPRIEIDDTKELRSEESSGQHSPNLNGGITEKPEEEPNQEHHVPFDGAQPEGLPYPREPDNFVEDPCDLSVEPSTKVAEQHGNDLHNEVNVEEKTEEMSEEKLETLCTQLAHENEFDEPRIDIDDTKELESKESSVEDPCDLSVEPSTKVAEQHGNDLHNEVNVEEKTEEMSEEKLETLCTQLAHENEFDEPRIDIDDTKELESKESSGKNSPNLNGGITEKLDEEPNQEHHVPFDCDQPEGLSYQREGKTDGMSEENLETLSTQLAHETEFVPEPVEPITVESESILKEDLNEITGETVLIDQKETPSTESQEERIISDPYSLNDSVDIVHTQLTPSDEPSYEDESVSEPTEQVASERNLGSITDISEQVAEVAKPIEEVPFSSEDSGTVYKKDDVDEPHEQFQSDTVSSTDVMKDSIDNPSFLELDSLNMSGDSLLDGDQKIQVESKAPFENIFDSSSDILQPNCTVHSPTNPFMGMSPNEPSESKSIESSESSESDIPFAAETPSESVVETDSLNEDSQSQKVPLDHLLNQDVGAFEAENNLFMQEKHVEQFPHDATNVEREFDPLKDWEESAEKEKKMSEQSQEAISGEDEFDPLKEWGQPMGLPSPAPTPGTEKSGTKTTKTTSKSPASKSGKTKEGPTKSGSRLGSAPTPSKSAAGKDDSKKATGSTGRMGLGIKKISSAPTSRSSAKENGAKPDVKKAPVKTEDTKKTTVGKRMSMGIRKVATQKEDPSKVEKPSTRATSRSKPSSAVASTKSEPAPVKMINVIPFYVDLAYIPHHGNSIYMNLNYFRRIRARYYVYSSLQPDPHVLESLLTAKQTWDDPSLETTVIPTYDTDALRVWMSQNREKLSDLKVDIAPSASRCTIQLQDHEASCAAYRLEF